MKKINKKLKSIPIKILSREDEIRVADLVNNPPPPNQKLKDAVRGSSIRWRKPNLRKYCGD